MPKPKTKKMITFRDMERIIAQMQDGDKDEAIMVGDQKMQLKKTKNNCQYVKMSVKLFPLDLINWLDNRIPVIGKSKEKNKNWLKCMDRDMK